MKFNTSTCSRISTLVLAAAVTLPLVGCTSGFAFQKRAVQVDEDTMIIHQPTMAAEDRAEMLTNEMDKVCKLTPNQRERIAAINLACAEKCDQMANSSKLSPAQTERAISRNWNLKNVKFQSVLTPRQYMAWYQHNADMYNKTSPMVKKSVTPEQNTDTTTVPHEISVHASALD